MTVRARVELAKVKIANVVNRISGLLAVAEQNALIVYSPLLSGQIPPSTAGHAFNAFQKAMHSYEIIQLSALWDKPDGSLAHNSIPIVHALVDDDAVIEQVVENVRRFWPSLPADDALAEYHRQTGDEEAGKALAALTQLRGEIPVILTSSLYVSVKNMRDRYLAHALDETRAEKRGQVAPMKYGDEQLLLKHTTDIIEILYLWMTGTHFDLAGNRQLQAKYALALWSKCRFDIAPRT